jgi:hypothetical protein
VRGYCGSAMLLQRFTAIGPLDTNRLGRSLPGRLLGVGVGLGELGFVATARAGADLAAHAARVEHAAERAAGREQHQRDQQGNEAAERGKHRGEGRIDRPPNRNTPPTPVPRPMLASGGTSLPVPPRPALWRGARARQRTRATSRGWSWCEACPRSRRRSASVARRTHLPPEIRW